MRALRGVKYTWDSEQRRLVEVRGETPREVEAPAVKADEVAPFQSMADCKMYTSKSAYRRSLREQGFIEVGNDVDGFKPKDVFNDKRYDEQLREDLTKSYYECRDKMAPLSEFEREKFKRMDRQRGRGDYDRRDRERSGKLRD